MKSWKRIATLVLATAWAGHAGADTGATPGSSPVLAWNQIALEAIERAKPNQHQTVRLLAHVSLAQHAALAESAPGATAQAIATASKQVIAGLMPSQADYVEQRARELGLQAGDTGTRIAGRVLARAAGDGFAQPWQGNPPPGDTVWRSLASPPAAPAYPAIGAMQTLLGERGDAFRPAPPPPLDSARFRDDLSEARRLATARSPESLRLARFYDMTTGILAGGFWNQQAAELIRRDRQDERRAVTILATLNAAMMDALVACHEAKYTYWVPRPSQVDPSIRPLISTPNHPSYPSNHSCLSTAAGLVLAHFFPGERGRLEGIGREAGESRIHAGIHYRFDVTAGEEIGRRISTTAVARHPDMLARWTQSVVGGF